MGTSGRLATSTIVSAVHDIVGVAGRATLSREAKLPLGSFWELEQFWELLIWGV